MRWFNWLGVGLQVVGLLGAMYLLALLRETVTGREVVPLRSVRAAWRRLRRFILRQLGRTPDRTIVGVGTAIEIETAGRAHGMTRRGPMPDALALDAQVAWVLDYVRDVERRHNELSSEVWHQANTQSEAVKAAREHAEQEIRRAVNEARSDFRTLVGQDVGWEIVSLLIVAIGVVLAAL